MFKGLNNILASKRIFRLSIVTLVLANLFGYSSAKNGGSFELRRILSSYKYNPHTAIKYAPEDESVDLRSYIKAALNVEHNNNSLDSIMSTAFNVDNPNPMYVFVLPVGLQNRTLVLRRSDFDHAIFPNISRLQRQIMSSNISRLYKLIENLDKPSWMSEHPDTTTEFLFTIDDTHNADLDEAESMKVVEENVRTERNFYKFMHYLNQHHETDNKAGSDNKYGRHADLLPSGSAALGQYTKYKPSQSQIEYSLHIDYTTAKPITDKQLQAVSWKDLGLDGWMGGIKEPGKEFDNILSNKPTERYKPKPKDQTTQRYRSSSYSSQSLPERQQTTHKSIKHSTPSPYSLPAIKNNNKKYFTPYSFEIPKIYENAESQRPVPPITKKYVESTTVSMYQKDSWEVPMQISNELNDLLKAEDLQFHNITGELRNSKPMWPVTSSRASHKDEDVFIARANNPFGHSTKWKWSNSTNSIDTKENRSKRGALILYSMVKCSTGCDPLIYKGYGCYCGFLGSGRTLDGIDRCCKMHDYCYEKAKCPMFLEYFVPYLWKCYRGRALCAIDHGEWGGPGSCAARLCECDQTLSKCLRRFYCPRKRAVCSSSPWRLLQNVLMA